MLNMLSPLKRYWNSHVLLWIQVYNSRWSKTPCNFKREKYCYNRAGLFHPTFAVAELQPSLFQSLGHGPDFPADKDLTEFYQQGQWMAKATKLKLPKQAQLSSGL